MPPPAFKPFDSLIHYPVEEPRVGRGLLIAVGIHLFVAGLVCLILFLLGIQSLKELLEKGGSKATSGPAPQEMIVELKLDDIKPPPTDHIEFIQQILKPKPQPVTPKPVPKPVVKPLVHLKPKFTAPNAKGSGNTDTVSSFKAGDSGLPHPPYPYNMMVAGIGGTCVLHVTFGASGSAESAEIVKSSGEAVLDANSRNYALGHWHNPDLANKACDIPVSYIPH